MKQIPLRDGGFTLVDDDIYAEFGHYTWKLNRDGYVCRNFYVNGKKNVKICLHRIVNNTPKGMHTDHINRNKLDNRRENLRTCTPMQNACNRKNMSNKTGYVGVHLDKQSGKYRAKIRIDRKYRSLGYYSTAEEAHRAYVAAARIQQGEFFPEHKEIKAK